MNLHETGNNENGVDSFIQSALFSRTFREGMALVEETANYLDGEGREISKTMGRTEALSYAGSSMRLTTQLMQIASWLLVMRALREGDMTIEEASDSKYRIRETDENRPKRTPAETVPDDLATLITHSDQLYDRIARLDHGLFIGHDQKTVSGAVVQQQALLAAFNGQ